MIQPGSGNRTIIATAIVVLIAGSIICALVVPIYASITPKVGDWPFFYFYLLAYMPVVALAQWIVMVLQRRLKAPAREAGSADAGTEAAR
ncbi:MAG TPA: hypothetical protein VG164_12905 [Trebonia sp.]|jgi:hypothetical protein|nr:hypothetical protein [Trebonia sp.]